MAIQRLHPCSVQSLFVKVVFYYFLIVLVSYSIISISPLYVLNPRNERESIAGSLIHQSRREAGGKVNSLERGLNWTKWGPE